MKNFLLACCVSSLLLSSGCATVFGGNKSDCQLIKPHPGEKVRQVRPWALVGDLGIPAVIGISAGSTIIYSMPSMALFLGIDFLTNSIYKPCPKTK